MEFSKSNHYAALGLDRDCAGEQIRAAYRLLAKQHHPDLNGGAREAVAQTQALNLAYEILSDPERRKEYDETLAAAAKPQRSSNGKVRQTIAQDVHLRIEEFFRGTTCDVRVNDPGNSAGREIYELVIPPETAVGTRFRLQRDFGGGLIIRVLPLPHFQFKIRGSDLRCDLKIHFKRAAQGGEEMVTGPTGSRLRVKIPAGIARGEVVRITGEGLPKPRGGRGDLLVRIMYQPEVRITRRGFETH
ncbi:MAG: J domain-containing protein [Akkermansiaceae bacterium]|nr:J domain-containing protein [Verrucomicrobiales bacterium]